MPDSRLVIPHDVEGLCVDVLKRLHDEHLAKLERQRGVAPRTFESLATVVRMSDAEGVRLGGDTVPACLVGVIGAPRAARNERDTLDLVFQMGVQVTVMGQRRRDTLLRRDCTAWSVIECLLQRLPRDPAGLISDVALVDYEPVSDSDTQRTVGDARIILEVGVPDALAVVGGLPADDSEWERGWPGGAPPEGEPYTPPLPNPVATTVSVEVDR